MGVRAEVILGRCISAAAAADSRRRLATSKGALPDLG